MDALELIGTIVLYPVVQLAGYVLAPVFYVALAIPLGLVIISILWAKDRWANRRLRAGKWQILVR